MKKKKIIGYIAFVLIFCVLLTGTYLFLKLTDINTLVAIKGYEYEKENELDVVMFGQSEVYTGKVWIHFLLLRNGRNASQYVCFSP